jgi:hypothetical protein
MVVGLIEELALQAAVVVAVAVAVAATAEPQGTGCVDDGHGSMDGIIGQFGQVISS